MLSASVGNISCVHTYSIFPADSIASIMGTGLNLVSTGVVMNAKNVGINWQPVTEDQIVELGSALLIERSAVSVSRDFALRLQVACVHCVSVARNSFKTI